VIPLFVLSPHLDDSVYSAGGQLSQQVRAGGAAVVLNLFAGAPGGALSPLAQEFHDRQGIADLVAHRIGLDRAAAGRLGASPVYLAFRDCLYRGSADGGTWYYTDPGQVFGPPHPAEAHLAEEVAEAIVPLLPPDRQVRVLAPLAVGGHVDHRIVRDAGLLLARQGWPVCFYEDIPYVMREGAVDQALTEVGGDDAGCWRLQTVFLEPEDSEAKLEAIALYRSSLPIETFANIVRDAGAGRPAERTWWWTAEAAPRP
jgi:LmbE family N-acetylglucosaminyl deacetylase